ncbi:hypothetical protein BG005_002100 [Podila minutissima]|nr:hypothetical protein BG005_002100 [Podila minutissima]
MAPVMPRPILKDTSAKDKALRESWMSEPPGNGINISHHSRPASGMTPGSSSSSPSPITPPKSLARANSASAKRQSKLSRMSAVEYDQDALTPRPRQPTVNGYGPDYRPRRQSGGPGHLLCALDPASGGIDESEDIDDSDLDDSLSRSKHLQDQYIRLQKSQLRQSIAENPVLPHGSSPDNTPYDKPRQRKSLGDELNVPPVPEKSAQRKRVSTMGSATLPAVSPSLSGALASVSESDSKKQKDRKPFATVGSNALSFEPLFVLKDGSPKQSRESSMLTTYRDSLASRLSGVSDADWASNPLLTDIIQPGVSILDLSKKDLIDIPSGLPTSITHLRLAYNSIHILAPLSSLTSLHQLQVLDLCDNQLDVLPSEIGLLSKLKELYLSNNKLWKLPDTIQRMARLEVLDIRGNQFYLLNPAIGRMKTLRQLDVRNNQLKSLPAPLCMLSTTLSVLLVDGNQFVQPFSDLLQPLFADSESGPQSFLGDDPYADSGRKNGSSTIKSTGVYEPWRRSVAPSTVKRVPTLIKRRSHGDLMTIVGLQKKEGYSNSTDDLAAELQKASTISGSAGAYIAASLGADSSPGRRERSVSTSNAGPSEFHSESGSSHSLSLNKFMKSFRKSSKSSLKDPSVSSSKKRLSAGSELEPSEDGHGSESVYGGSQYEQDDSGAKGAHHSGKRGTSGGINQWVRDRFHKRANSNELGSLPNASSTSINLDAQDSEPHSVRDSGYDGVGTPHSPDLSAPSSGLGARMNKSTGHLPFGSPVSPRETQLLSSFDPLLKKDRDYRFSYMSMESQMTQGTENDVDALDISVPLSSAQHRLSSMYSPTTPLPSSPVMLATSAGSNSAWNSGAGPRYGQSAAQIKPIMHYLKDLHDLDPDSSEWEEVYAWRRVWNAERSTTLGLTGNEADQDQDQEEGGQQAKAEEMRLAKLQAQATRRRKIIAEIIETERTYVDGLKGLVEIYLTPAQQVMPASDHKGVFSNAQALYTFHASHFLPELEKAYAVTRETKTPIASSSPMSPIPSSSPFLSDPSAPTSASSSTAALGVHQESVGQSSDISAMSTPQESCIEGTNGDNTGSVIATTPPPETECRIGRVFAEHVAYMKMYSFYVNNYDNALRVLQTQLTHSKYKKKTKEFLRRCAKHPNHTQLGLQGYLLLPVQRIPRYKMLLGDLLENTWPDHVDYQDIATALDNVSSRADEMNERKRQYENHEKVLLVQNRIVGQYKTPLVQPHRKVVREGMLHLIRTVTRNVSMSEKAVVPTGQTPVGDLTMHHLSEETVEKSFLFILFNDIMIQCQPCGPKTSSSTTNVTGAGAGGTGGSGVTAGAGSGANAAGASDGTKNLELCRVLQLESRLHPAEVIGNDVLRVVDDAMVMYLTGDKDVIQAWKEDINSRW